MRLFGLIGFPLSHSFSRQYFTDKFKEQGIDAEYHNFEIDRPEKFHDIRLQYPNLEGLNVTIPHKQTVIKYLDELDDAARQIGAVNTIAIEGDKCIGYNTDVIGFEESLKPLLQPQHKRALILGSGGASKAVSYVLHKLGIEFKIVSRSPGAGHIGYWLVMEELLQEHKLIINTTPLGMFPNMAVAPAISYKDLTPDHLLYDLVYNPEQTEFLKSGQAQGARTKNGLEMLHRQAEAAWEIWNR